MLNQLTSVTIGNGVTSIGYGAFYKNQLTSVAIPSSVTTIEKDAFWDNKLTSISIGANVTIVSDSFPYSFSTFSTFYNAQGRVAGTYTYNNWTWSRR
jgi:hypothetical protein